MKKNDKELTKDGLIKEAMEDLALLGIKGKNLKVISIMLRVLYEKGKLDYIKEQINNLVKTN